MSRLSLFLASLLALGFVVVSSWLLIPACSILPAAVASYLNFCPNTGDLEVRRALIVVADDNQRLAAEVARLERELGATQCTAVYEEPEPPVAPPVTPPAPPPVAEPDPEVIDRDRWGQRDLALLEGCWELDSNYRTTNVRTRVVTDYNDWRICFQPGGAGRQRMVGVANTRPPRTVVCEDSLNAAFNDAGNLVISEPRNLQCNDRSFIYRREITCRLDSAGRARCDSLQPELGRRSPVGLRRTTREF